MNRKMTLTSLAFPMFIESLLRQTLGIVNVFMLSQYSDKAVGAIGVSTQVISMVLVIYNVVSLGSAVIVNQYLGSGNKETASQVVKVALAANIIFGLALSLILAVFAGVILNAMKIPADLIGYASRYLIIVGGASFTQAIMSIMSGIARSYGHAKFPMYVAVEVNILNLIGNYLVIFKPFGLPALGVTGISVSLVISQVIGMIILAFYFFHWVDVKFTLKDIIFFPKSILKNIIKIGVPSAGEFLSYSGSQMVTTCIVAMLGSNALTTKAYIQNIMFIVWMLGMAIGQATMILVGHLVGLNRMQDAYKRGNRSLLIAMTADTVSAVIMFLIGSPVLHIFTRDPAIINLGITLLLITILLEPGRAFNLVIGNSLRGAGDVKYPVFMGILSMWLISVPLCYILGVHYKLGLAGIWLAFTADEWVRGIILMLRWRSRIWQDMSLVKANYISETAI